jgi:hypothetical protein
MASVFTFVLKAILKFTYVSTPPGFIANFSSVIETVMDRFEYSFSVEHGKETGIIR